MLDAGSTIPILPAHSARILGVINAGRGAGQPLGSVRGNPKRARSPRSSKRVSAWIWFPARPQAHVHGRAGAVHRGLARLRAGHQRHVPDHHARRPGPGRRRGAALGASFYGYIFIGTLYMQPLTTATLTTGERRIAAITAASWPINASAASRSRLRKAVTSMPRRQPAYP